MDKENIKKGVIYINVSGRQYRFIGCLGVVSVHSLILNGYQYMNATFNMKYIDLCGAFPLIFASAGNISFCYSGHITGARFQT